MKTPPRGHVTPENLRQQKLHQLEESEAFFLRCFFEALCYRTGAAQEKLLFKCAMEVAQNCHVLLKQS